MNVLAIALTVIGICVAIGMLYGWLDELGRNVAAGLFAGGIMGAIVGLLAVVVVVWPTSLGYSNPRDMTCTVTDKDRAKTDGGSDMRVYTSDCGVLKAQDLFWAWEWHSADTFSAIEPGHRYRFHITGIRAPFFSVFPNIRTVEAVSQ